MFKLKNLRMRQVGQLMRDLKVIEGRSNNFRKTSFGAFFVNFK